jgi:hypothetical protein
MKDHCQGPWKTVGKQIDLLIWISTQDSYHECHWKSRSLFIATLLTDLCESLTSLISSLTAVRVGANYLTPLRFSLFVSQIMTNREYEKLFYKVVDMIEKGVYYFIVKAYYWLQFYSSKFKFPCKIAKNRGLKSDLKCFLLDVGIPVPQYGCIYLLVTVQNLAL